MPSFEVAVPLILLLPLLWVFFKAKTRKPGPNLPPGPQPLPIIGNLHMLGQKPHRALAELAQKYGPIMSLRLGHVPTIVVSSAQAAELFLKQHDAVFANRPMLLVWDHMVYGAKDVAFTPHGDYWRRVRKMCVIHLLSAAKVAGFEGLRRAEIEAAVRRLAEAAVVREVVDVGERVGELIEDIVFKMLIGKAKEDKRYDFRGVIQEALTLAGAFNLADFTPWLAPLDLQGLIRRTKAARKATDEIFDDIIENHNKEEDFGQNRDIIGLLLSLMHNPTNELPSSSFGVDNVKALMFDLFAGGIDTTYVTITWVLSALIKHPRVMRLVQDELDSIVGRERMLVESDLSKLTYLDMVIKETFRLYPAAPLLGPRESMEDVIVHGFMIPNKSRVITNGWAIGRDPNVWSENAEEFYPERFMGRDIDVRGLHFELIPFGAGRRVCPGMHLALTNIKLVVAQLVHCFDWELPNGMCPDDVDMTEKFGLSMPRANKLYYASHNGEPQQRVQENVKAIMLDLFVAGIDTSLQTIIWALSELTKHPRVMKLLREELDARIGKHRMVLESDLSKLTYLDMVVRETFRLYLVPPLLAPHESMEDVIIDGYMIPKKSRVVINFWAIGHDPRV
ncbi:hypothetical protein Cgig2_005642 [Carnegiea gigantea]|uniref:Cytochrome P450 n=1 Tax=Carnegiea gigantea TaxID=171969 RepID=A0A9Q1KV49_9CARY|nr:hypothetical protein Cgig2_005642 [Carnegiea gigantea]